MIARSGCQIDGVSTDDPCYPIPAPLTVDETYYWAVDEVEVGGSPVHPGVVWNFTVAPKIASTPIPADGTVMVDPNVALSWTAGSGAINRDVYFGTDPCSLPLVSDNQNRNHV